MSTYKKKQRTTRTVKLNKNKDIDLLMENDLYLLSFMWEELDEVQCKYSPNGNKYRAIERAKRYLEGRLSEITNP